MGLRRTLAILLAVALGAGCAERTEIIVVADTNMRVPEEIERIRFEVVGPSGETKTATAELNGFELPAYLGVVHAGGPLGPVTISAIAEFHDIEILRRVARVSFVEGRTVELRLDLTRDCVPVTCGADQTCAGGACGPIDVDGSSLPNWSGTATRIDASVPFDAGFDAGEIDGGVDAGPDDGGVDAGPCPGGCDDGVPCTMDTCEMTGCVHTPDATMCDDGVDCTTDACDPTMGCTSTPNAAACDDGVACTVDECHPLSGCIRSADSMLCARGDLCDPTMGCVTGPTFSSIYPIFMAECSPCHTSGPTFSANLNMETQTSAYASLVGVTAQCGAGANTLVIPYDARASLLWRKIANVDLCGMRMPNGRTPLTPAQIDSIAQWINAGAADN